MRTLVLLGLLAIASSLQATFLPPVVVSIQGTIINTESGAPLEYATISVFNSTDELIDGTVTNVEGIFELELETGDYRLQFEFLGFETQEQEISLQANMNLGEISLGPNGLNLDAVEVRAQRSQMSLQLDKKVFDIGQDALSRGGSANQVLENLPSVDVSVDGTVSLRGDAGVRILINGRPSALADNNALEGIPAESIEKVEIITNPSARYEASGTGGIINIILKKERSLGYGGTLSLATGYPADHRINLNLNLRKNKFNAFANLGARYSNYRGNGDLTRTSSLDIPLANLEQVIDMDRNDKAGSVFTGFDYNFSENSVLTASYSVYDMINDDITFTDYEYFDQNGATTQIWDQVLDYLEPGNYQQIDLIYNRSFAQEGRSLSLQFNTDRWKETETEQTQFSELLPEEREILNYRTTSDEGSSDYLLQLDYETPLGENSNIEVGLRGETRIISADILAEQFLNDEWNVLPGFENDLDYYEEIGAAYFQYRYQKDGFGIQLGLRDEFINVRVEQSAEPGNDFTKSYNRLFPSGSVNYRFSDATSTSLSYSRRIRRPSFWQLNPFRGLNDPTTLFVGNPDLDPIYIDRYELNFVQRWEKLTLNPAVYLDRVQDFFAFVAEQESDNVLGLESGTIVTRPVNLDRELRYGGELIANYRPSESLSFSGEVNVYVNEQRGDLGERNFDIKYTTWSSGLRMQLELPKDINFSTRFSYNGPFRDVQSVRRGTSNINLALSKQWNNRITLTVQTRSPRYGRDELFRPTFQQENYFAWTGWRTSLNFQYRFEKGAGSDGRRTRGSIR